MKFPTLPFLLALAACQPDQPQQEAANSPATYRAYPTPRPASAYTIKHPAWAAHASIYEVNIRQYTPEGTFRAFEAHLPRLQQMGVGILWLMPIHPIGQEKRKGTLGSYYSVRDFRAVNPDMGTLADLQHLTAEAHQRGMHVILDWVANHTAWDNPLVQQHPDWYTRDAKGQLVPPVADWQDVVDLDYSKPELRAWMTESMAYWVREADIDGYRCDVAGLVPTEFWNDTRAALDQIKPVFMLAEWDELHHPPFVDSAHWNPDTRLLERAFDATYALNLLGRLDSVGQTGPFATLDNYQALKSRVYPQNISLMNFTSSHDVNSWEGSEFERYGNRDRALKMAALAMLLPGVPMVYSGQEVGLKKRLSFFEKDTINWKSQEDKNGLFSGFYRLVLNLKKHHPALVNWDSTSHFKSLNSQQSIEFNMSSYAFTRSKGKDAVLVAMSWADADPSLMPDSSLAGQWRDLFTNETITISAGKPLGIGGVCILVRDTGKLNYLLPPSHE